MFEEPNSHNVAVKRRAMVAVADARRQEGAHLLLKSVHGLGGQANGRSHPGLDPETLSGCRRLRRQGRARDRRAVNLPVLTKSVFLGRTRVEGAEVQFRATCALGWAILKQLPALRARARSGPARLDRGCSQAVRPARPAPAQSRATTGRSRCGQSHEPCYSTPSFRRAATAAVPG